MSAVDILLLLALLQLKHLIVDWIWQPPYEHLNKGKYGHFGGIRHAGKNAIGTALCFLPFFGIAVAILVLLWDFIIHYHIDWIKVNYSKIRELHPMKHAEFWYVTGTDQFCHQITYILLILLAVW